MSRVRGNFSSLLHSIAAVSSDNSSMLTRTKRVNESFSFVILCRQLFRNICCKPRRSQGATYFCEPPILLSDDNLRTGPGIAGEREHFLRAGD